MVEITQADREAATRWGTGPVYNAQHLAEAFARHRIAAEQAERSRIVAWLREQWDDASVANLVRAITDAIEAGDHL